VPRARLFATFVGEHRYNDRLPSVSFEDLARRNEADKDFLRRLEAIDRLQLGVQDRINCSPVTCRERARRSFRPAAATTPSVDTGWRRRRVALVTVMCSSRMTASRWRFRLSRSKR